MLNYTVQFSDDFSQKIPYCDIQVSGSDGVLLNEFKMSFDDFIDCIIDSEVAEELNQKRYRILGRKKIQKKIPRYVSPVLPKNCIRHIWLNTEKKEQVFFIEVPKNRWDIHFYDSPMEQVGFPRLIFGYRMMDHRCIGLFLFAVKENGRLKGDTELCMFPYANVSDGRVCMGGNSLPTFPDLAQLSTYHNLFFAAPSSNCYYGSYRNHSGIQDLRELYTKMQGQDFPEEWLAKKKITFDQFCQNL